MTGRERAGRGVVAGRGRGESGWLRGGVWGGGATRVFATKLMSSTWTWGSVWHMAVRQWAIQALQSAATWGAGVPTAGRGRWGGGVHWGRRGERTLTGGGWRGEPSQDPGHKDLSHRVGERGVRGFFLQLWSKVGQRGRCTTWWHRGTTEVIPQCL